MTARRKRQVEYLALLEHLDRAVPSEITTIDLLADNVSVHHGKLVRPWLDDHPRVVAHFTPAHCSWMNPVEQWFGILRRKRLRSPNFADLAALQQALHQFIADWNTIAHPFRWTPAPSTRSSPKSRPLWLAHHLRSTRLPNPSDVSEDLY